MRSKEVEDAIEGLKNGKFTAYSGSTTAIYKIKDVETLLNYISELEEMLIRRIAYTQDLEKDLFENCENYVVSKDKIRKIKEKHEQKRDFYRWNMQGYSYDRECEIIEEYEELLEGE